jgi:dTMP kinase
VIDWSLPAEVFLHFAARAEHLERTIRPALRAGLWVVCDRFYDSTMAYQGYGLGADRGLIAALSTLLGLTPDLTIVLQATVPTTLLRLSERGDRADRYERLGADFFARVAAGFADIAAAAPERCVVVPAEGDVTTVHDAVLAAVRARLGVAV